jgi:hypothetical protein
MPLLLGRDTTNHGNRSEGSKAYFRIKGKVKDRRTMKTLKTTVIILAGILFLWANSGQALISPDHYERIMKERQKKENEKKNQQTPDSGQNSRLKKAQPTTGQTGGH